MPNYYPLLFKRKVVEFYKKTKLCTIDVLKVFGISNGSLFNWIILYDNNKLTSKKHYIKKYSKITPNIKCYIRKYVLKKINFNFKLLIKYIKRHFNIVISKSSIYNILKQFNISSKKIRIKKIYGKKDILNNKIQRFKKIIKSINKDRIISIDEVSFDTTNIYDKGWSLKGTRIYKNVNANRTRYSCICAINNKKIIKHKTVKGSINKEIFLQFIKTNLEYFKNKYILLDNARIHHSLIVKEYIKNNNINFIFNVPYHPEFNPIESVFSKSKRIVNTNLDNDKNLLKNIDNSFKRIRKRDLKNFYNNSFDTLFNFKKYRKIY